MSLFARRRSSISTRMYVLLHFLLPIILAHPLRAQDPGGVRLGLLYQSQYQPGLVVLPFAGTQGSVVQTIIRQDLDFSDQFTVRSTPTDIRPGEPVNAGLWKERGADWILDGSVQSGSAGLILQLSLYDAVYGQIKAKQTFALPVPTNPGFRMAVHAAADEVVRWATGEPGVAATQIVYSLRGRGSQELYIADSDGENVQRLTTDGSYALSPAWSPDGSRIAYTSYRSGTAVLYERDLPTGRDRVISDRPEGINTTPAYSPDGRILAFATTVEGFTQIFTYDVARNCCLRQITSARRSDSLNPIYSPDGKQIAFVSNRLGQLQIHVMPADGGEARLVSEYAYGQSKYNAAPDWSAVGSTIAYQAQVGNVRGVHQLVIVDPVRGTRRLLTNRWDNEDPSFAPDGRHLVFSSPDRDGGGIFVLDTVSGRIRSVLRGKGYGLPAWSPSPRRVLSSGTSIPSASGN